MINKNISYYFNSSDSKSRIYYNFDHILELIASNPKLSKQTDMVRKQTTEKAYKEEKHRLPMIAPSGIFDYRNDDPTSLRQYSNLLVLDFDDFGSHEAAGEFKERLIQSSPSLRSMVLSKQQRCEGGYGSRQHQPGASLQSFPAGEAKVISKD